MVEVDAFADAITWPRATSGFPSAFFQYRLVDEDDAHIRGFAGEMFQVAVVIHLIIHMVLKPAGPFA